MPLTEMAGFAIIDMICDNLLNRRSIFLNQVLLACSILLILTIMLPHDYRGAFAAAGGQALHSDSSMTGGLGTKVLRDQFGIEMVYPSKLGGEEWFINMNNPTSDKRFNPQDEITKNGDGSWKMRSDKVRMLVYTEEGYHMGEITHSAGQSGASERGFLQSPSDWKNVEITGYVKLNSFSQIDNFVWYARSGIHSDSDPCQGDGYKGNLNYVGDLQFAKEQWHVSYVKTPIKHAIGPLNDKWVGLKFIEYNYNINDGGTSHPATKLELWLDPDADGRNWIKGYEGADRGQWGRTGAACYVKPDQIITWGGPVATFRWDFAQDVDFKYLSAREIQPDGGNINNIDFFTGTYRGHGFPDFGAPDSIDRVDSQGNALQNMQVANIGYYNANSESLNKKVVRQGNNTYIVWVEGDEDNTDVYMKISHDNGTTYSTPINLSNNPSSLSAQPDIIVNGTDIYVTWEDDDGNSGNTDILYRKISDGGKSFEGEKNISNDPEGSTEPQLTLKNSTLLVDWKVPNPRVSEFKHKQSTDGGRSFTFAETSASPSEISGMWPQNYNAGNLSEALSANGTSESQIHNGTNGVSPQNNSIAFDLQNDKVYNDTNNVADSNIFGTGNITRDKNLNLQGDASGLIKKSELALRQLQGMRHLANGSKNFDNSSTNVITSPNSRFVENLASKENVDGTNPEAGTTQFVQNTSQGEVQSVGPKNKVKSGENVEHSDSNVVLKTDPIKNQTSQIFSKLEKGTSRNYGNTQFTKEGGQTSEIVHNAEDQDNDDKSIADIEPNHTPTVKNAIIKNDENRPVLIQLKGKDRDKSDILRFDILTKTKNGKIISFNHKSGKVIYEPEKDHTGSDEFLFTVTDGKATSKEGKVVIYVKKMDKQNDEGHPTKGGNTNKNTNKNSDKEHISFHAREKNVEDSSSSSDTTASNFNSDVTGSSNVDGFIQ